MPSEAEVLERQRVETRCYCDACKHRRGESNSILPGVLHTWDYRPRTFRERRLKDDNFPYVLGVELETSQRYSISGEAMRTTTAIGLRRPKRLWYAKYDSSVSGPEFVSYPATLPYWHDKEPELSEMFRLLVHAGYRSHNGGEAGMHVNIDKGAFENARHLHRLLTWLYVNYNQSLVLSQRSRNQAEQWAPSRTYDERLASRMLSNLEWRSPTGKYCVVGAPARGSRRLEFRLPRGTLRLDRFYKNLEWTAALIAYTRTPEALDVTEGRDFLTWLTRSNQSHSYNNLLSFYDEKSSVVGDAIMADNREKLIRAADCDFQPKPLFERYEPESVPSAPSNPYDVCNCVDCTRRRS